MSQPTQNPPSIPRSLADRVNESFPGAMRDLVAAGPRRQIRGHTAGQVVVLEADGSLTDVIGDLDRAIQLALAELPRGVVCDLSDVRQFGAADALAGLGSAGRHVRDWPGIPVAVACPDTQARDALSGKALGGHLLATDALELALSAILGTASSIPQTLRLPPHPTAPRAARNFVSRALLDWQLVQHIPSACLVISELVTNAMVHAGTDIDVSLATHRGALRLTVRDQGADLPQPRTAGIRLHGRGLTIVEGLTDAWGVLPTADDGKVVWAVLAASTSPIERHENDRSELTRHQGHARR